MGHNILVTFAKWLGSHIGRMYPSQAEYLPCRVLRHGREIDVGALLAGRLDRGEAAPVVMQFRLFATRVFGCLSGLGLKPKCGARDARTRIPCRFVFTEVRYDYYAAIGTCRYASDVVKIALFMSDEADSSCFNSRVIVHAAPSWRMSWSAVLRAPRGADVMDGCWARSRH